MKILYTDEYGELVYEGTGYPPAPGDTVIIDTEEWIVKSRTFIPFLNQVAVIITDSVMKQKVDSAPTDAGRLNEMRSAILNINKRQDATEKTNRNLREELVTVRKFINQKLQKDRKNDDPR